ncbi:DUF6745 domain-containing protein [Aerosakkonema funiforme]|uniref:DUF6745 domain-containing protein n=1 Tax=Aerosakkonema funiforme FACHB-1375 TaxID=2949571 RepID=A0A926ZMQ8_9CYAN|nr:hypothetical protein [Aerosakkonema funiforme]MBD2186306.1 hypothetical protein [Aerosakkonema funiforme FACHB-1375]
MSPTKVEKLTPEQEALIPVYRHKWRGIDLSTEPIDRQKAAHSVKAAYAAMGKPEPEIRFLSSPAALGELVGEKSAHQLAQEFGAPLLTWLPTQLCDRIQHQIQAELWQKLQSESSHDRFSLLLLALPDFVIPRQDELLGQLWLEWQDRLLQQMWEQQQASMREHLLEQPGGEFISQIGDFLWMQMGEPLSRQLEETLWKPLANLPAIQQWQQDWHSSLLGIASGWALVSGVIRNMQALSIDTIDFCISVLNCDYDRQKWSALQSLVQDCGWVFPLERACLVCDRPRQMRYDSENRLHAEGEPAIEFADGYRVYAYRGVRLPEKYGSIYPHQWQAEWLLEENNAELRRVLIQGIGYGRICQELQAQDLDSWREYTLLKIDSDVDVEPIYLLKMTCPSTGYIHATRVPPHMRSAREAIGWVNWGIDPAEFSVET